MTSVAGSMDHSQLNFQTTTSSRNRNNNNNNNNRDRKNDGKLRKNITLKVDLISIFHVFSNFSINFLT